MAEQALELGISVQTGGAQQVHSLEDAIAQLASAVGSLDPRLNALGESSAAMAAAVDKLGKSHTTAKKPVEELGSEAEKSAKKFKEAQKTIREFGELISSHLMNPLGGVSAGFDLASRSLGIHNVAAGLAVTALGFLVKESFEAAESFARFGTETANMSVRTGLSTKEVGQFSFAAKAAGVNAETLESGMRMLSQALSDNSEEGKKAKAALVNLGIATHNTATGELRPTLAILTDLGEALNKLPNATDRFDAAQQVLGRGGRELLPLLLRLKELLGVSYQLDVGLDESKIAKLEELHLNLEKLAAQWDVLKLKFAVPLAITVDYVLQYLNGIQGKPGDTKSTLYQGGQDDRAILNSIPDSLHDFFHGQIRGTTQTEREGKAVTEALQRKNDEARKNVGADAQASMLEDQQRAGGALAQNALRNSGQTKDDLAARTAEAKAKEAKARADLEAALPSTDRFGVKHLGESEKVVQPLIEAFQKFKKAAADAEAAQKSFDKAASKAEAAPDKVKELTKRLEQSQLKGVDKTEFERQEAIKEYPKYAAQLNVEFDKEVAHQEKLESIELSRVVLHQKIADLTAKSTPGQAKELAAAIRKLRDQEALSDYLTAASPGNEHQATADFQKTSAINAGAEKTADDAEDKRQAARKTARELTAIAREGANQDRQLSLNARPGDEEATEEARKRNKLNEAAKAFSVTGQDPEKAQADYETQVRSATAAFETQQDELRKKRDEEGRTRAVQTLKDREAYELKIIELQTKPGAEADNYDAIAQIRISTAEKEYAITKDRLTLERSTLDALIEKENQQAEFRKAQEDKARGLAGGLFDAALGGQSAMRSFGLGIAKDIGKTIFQNVATDSIQSGTTSLSKMIPGQYDDQGKTTGIGSALKGTLLGALPGFAGQKQKTPEQLQQMAADLTNKSVSATSTLGTAMGTLTQAVIANTAAQQGKAGSGGGAGALNADGSIDTSRTMPVTLTDASGNAITKAVSGASAAVSLGTAFTGGASSAGFDQLAKALPAALGGAGKLFGAFSGVGKAVAGPTISESFSGGTAAIGAKAPGDAVQGVVDPFTLPSISTTASQTAAISSAMPIALTSAAALWPQFAKGAVAGASGAGVNYNGIAGLASGLGHVGDLSGIFTGASALPGGGFQSLNTNERIGGAIATGLAAAGGIATAVKDFSKGGARGALGGASSLLGVASMIPGPQQPFIMGAAVVTGLIKDLLGDPVAQRKKQIQNELQDQQYLMPNSRNVTADLYSGGIVDRDQYGQARVSKFNAYKNTNVNPSLQRSYVGDHNQEPIPGYSTNPFVDSNLLPNGTVPGSNSVQGSKNTTGAIAPNPSGMVTSGRMPDIHIHAMDARSIMDRSDDIASAVSKAMQQNHPLSDEVVRRAKWG